MSRWALKADGGVPERSLTIPRITWRMGLGGDVSNRLPASLPAASLARDLSPLGCCCLSILAEGHGGGPGVGAGPCINQPPPLGFESSVSIRTVYPPWDRNAPWVRLELLPVCPWAKGKVLFELKYKFMSFSII